MHFHQRSLECTQYPSKGVWKDPQTLSEVIKLVEKLDMAQQVTATLVTPMVNLMTNNDRCFVCGKKGHIGQHCPDVQCYNCDGFGHFSQDCPEKIPPSRNLIPMMVCAPAHTMIATAETDHTPSITDAANVTALTGQDHTIDLNTTEAPVTTGEMHLTLYPTATVACDTLPYTDALGDTPVDTPYTVTDTTNPWPYNSSYQSHSHNYSTDHTQSSSRHSSDTTHRLHTQKTSKPNLQTANPHRPQCQKKVHTGLTVRLFLKIRRWFGCFKLLEPSSSSDEDSNEWGGQHKHNSLQ